MKSSVRKWSARSRPYPTTNLSSISKPTYLQGISMRRRDGLVSSAQISSDAGLRLRRFLSR